jgi:hypothetical protein
MAGKGMTRKKAFDLCQKLNPPLDEQIPHYFAVYSIGKEYFVEDLRTKELRTAEKE